MRSTIQISSNKEFFKILNYPRIFFIKRIWRVYTNNLNNNKIIMKNQNSELFYLDKTDLASRTSANNLRFKIEQVISIRKIAVIDLTNVISISESYADELFAVLVAQHGLEWFSNNIKLLYQLPHSNHVLLTISTAIRHRLENQESFAIIASVDKLIAMKKINK